MNTDVEDLLRDGMERFTTGVHAPVGLAGRAGRLHRQHRRRLAARATVACGAAVVAAIAVGSDLRRDRRERRRRGAAQARTVAYVTKRVENALAGENLVFCRRTRTARTGATPSPGRTAPGTGSRSTRRLLTTVTGW